DDVEIAEDEKKSNQAINTERKLDQVAGNKLQAGCVTVPNVNQNSKDRRQADPDAAPNQGSPETNGFRAPVKDSQIENQHQQDKQVEQNPEKQVVLQWLPVRSQTALD